MRSFLFAFLGTLGLILVAVILFSASGYHSVQVMAAVLLVAAVIFIIFRARIGIALLVASVVLFLALNGLKKTTLEGSQILQTNFEVGQASIPMGYIILIGVVLLVGSLLISTIRNNRWRK